jgi:hypothetical protein
MERTARAKRRKDRKPKFGGAMYHIPAMGVNGSSAKILESISTATLASGQIPGICLLSHRSPSDASSQIFRKTLSTTEIIGHRARPPNRPQ